MTDETTKIFQTIDRNDPEALKKAHLAVLDMIRVKIEEGSVASMAFIMIAKDPEVNGGKAYQGSRFIVHPTHMDLLEDAYKQMMKALVDMYDVTPDMIRKDRRRGKIA